MKLKIILLLAFFALASSESFADRRSRQQKKNSVSKVNKRNKKGLKKWGLAQVVRWEEVTNAG